MTHWQGIQTFDLAHIRHTMQLGSKRKNKEKQLQIKEPHTMGCIM